MDFPSSWSSVYGLTSIWSCLLTRKRACDDEAQARGTFIFFIFFIFLSWVKPVGWNQASVWKLTFFPQSEKPRQNTSEQWWELWLIMLLSTLKYRSSVQQPTCGMCYFFCHELFSYMHIKTLVSPSIIQIILFYFFTFQSGAQVSFESE